MTNDNMQSDRDYERLIKELNLGILPRESFVQLYRNGIVMGKPYYASLRGVGGRIEVEVSLKNDRYLDLIDALVASYEHQCSCGLARVICFSSPEDFLTFSRRLSIAVLLGFRFDEESQIGEAALRD
jgi:hypothetical protein